MVWNPDVIVDAIKQEALTGDSGSKSGSADKVAVIGSNSILSIALRVPKAYDIPRRGRSSTP